jgi:uncharacterized protein YbaP (TraB family)
MPRIFVLAALLLSCFSASAADDGGKHFLWRVSKGDASMYLTGSIHVLRKSDYPLPDALESAFKSCDGLVEEIDLTHFDPDAAQLEMMRLGSYPAGHSLKTDLPPDIYQRVSGLAKQQKVDMDMLEPMKPWLASIVLLDNQLVAKGYDPTSGVDIHFADEAEAAHKPVIGLEKASFQLGLLAQLPDQAQQAMLLQSLDQAGSVHDDMEDMMSAWHHGDTADLESELKREFGPYPDIYKTVLVQRNQNWIPQLEKLAGSGKQYFVVVGALHLVGPDGVLASLEKDGYRIEQL